MLLFMFTYIMQLIYYSGIYQADVWYDQTKNETLVRFVCLKFNTIVQKMISSELNDREEFSSANKTKFHE